MNKISLFLVPLAILLLSSPVLASDTAKSMAMGGAVVAIGDDLSAPYINPAGLANMKKTFGGLSMTSNSISWGGDADASGSRTNLFEHLGGATPLGTGAIYAGTAANNWSFADIDNPGVGSDVIVDTWLNTPGVAYGLEVMPGLKVGGGLNYLMRSTTSKQPDTDDELSFSGTGIGAVLGALYSATPTVNVGGSVTLLGDVISSGKLEMPSGDLDIDRTNNSLPSTLRLGVAVKPMPDLTVSGQFDLVTAVNFEQEFATEEGSSVMEIRTDGVVVTRLGVEYLVAQGKVPLWAGVSFTPGNNCEITAMDSGGIAEWAMFSTGGYIIPNSTTISVGAGYNEEIYSLGIALSSTSGTFSIPAADEITISETKVLVSGTIRI